MGTPHSSKGKNREFTVEEAKDFAQRFCDPKDAEKVASIDTAAREAAWTLLKELNAKEESDETPEEEPEEHESFSDSPSVEEAPSKENLKDSIKDRVTKLGIAAILSLSCGLYFQVGVIKEKSFDVAVTAEKEFHAFSRLSSWVENTFGTSLTAFNGIITEAEKSAPASQEQDSPTVSANAAPTALTIPAQQSIPPAPAVTPAPTKTALPPQVIEEKPKTSEPPLPPETSPKTSLNTAEVKTVVAITPSTEQGNPSGNSGLKASDTKPSQPNFPNTRDWSPGQRTFFGYESATIISPSE